LKKQSEVYCKKIRIRDSNYLQNISTGFPPLFYETEGSGIESHRGERISSPLQTGFEAHPASNELDNGGKATGK